MDSTLNITPGLNVGDKLLHFQVQEQLASGGQGIVWRGYDSLLDRSVAIKQIASADAVDEAFRERFHREADLQKKVSAANAHVVSIIDLVDDPRGLFIVMEYVDGQSLDRLLATTNGPLDPILTLKIVRDVAIGLAAVHHAGVIHRDLKPGNILLPRQGPARICDFGLARLVESQDSMNVGTVAYMAPELFGEEGADGRADLYALGMIAYEMLAGRPAFEQAFKAVLRDQRNQAMRWMKWHTNMRVAAPPLNELNPKVPPVLADLVARLMNKDPGQRIASAAQLVEAINRHFAKGAKGAAGSAGAGAAAAVAGRPAGAVATGPMTAAPTAALAKKKRWPAIAAGVVVFWCLVLGGVYAWNQRQVSVENEQRLADAKDRFTKVSAAWNGDDYATAKEIAEPLSAEFATHDVYGLAAKAIAIASGARLEMDRGEKLMTEGQYDEASKVFTDASDAFGEARDVAASQQTIKFTDRIAKMMQEADKRTEFVKLVAKAERDLAADKLDDAQLTYNGLKQVMIGSTGTAAMTAAERAKLAEVYELIQGKRQELAISEAHNQAQQLIALGKLLEARDFVEEKIRDLGSHAILLTDLKSVTTTMNLRTYLDSAQAAETARKWGEAAVWYEKAYDLAPSSDLKATIARCKINDHMDRGASFEQSNDTTGATKEYEAVLVLDPTNESAKNRIRAIGGAKERSQLLQEAGAAMAAGRFDEAITKYRQVLEMAVDADTQQKLNEAIKGKFRAVAQQHTNDGRYAQAIEAIEEILKIDGSDAWALKARAQIQFRQKLIADAAAADDMRAQGKHVQAKKAYRDLIALAEKSGVKLEPVERALADTELEHLIQQARSAIEVKDATLARATMNVAFKFYRDESNRRADTASLEPIGNKLKELDAEVADLEAKFGK